MNEKIQNIPWMHTDEIATIEKYISKNTVMLEWGSGGSTLYFANKVKRIHSIEHNHKWYQKLKSHIAQNVTLKHVDANNLVPIADSTFDDYRNYILEAKTFNTKFDAVLIDGRARVECAIFALDIIRTNSVVIIHDFYKRNRQRYRRALDYYDIIDKVDYTKQGVVVLKPKPDLVKPVTDVQKEIFRAKKYGNPLSVVRFGDGEYYASQSPYSSAPICDVPFKKHLGFVPEKHHKQEISDNIMTACRNADLVCVPEYPGKWLKSRRYFTHNSEKVYAYPANFHTYWLEENFFNLLFSKFHKVLLINGHPVAAGLKRKYPKLRIVNQIHTPKQTVYFSEEKRHYPDEFNRIMARIDELDLRGYLCLTGAGFIGKRYIVKCAERGAISIDIGSVFDRWAGYITRGKGKGFQQKNKLYEL